MTLFFRNSEIEISRRRRITNTNRFNLTVTYTAYPADIQPASNTRIQLTGGRFGASFTGFVEVNVDIKEGDQIVDGDGKKYSVQGVQKWQSAGLLDYQELILVAQDGN